MIMMGLFCGLQQNSHHLSEWYQSKSEPAMRSEHGDTPQAAVFKRHKVNLKILKLFWGDGGLPQLQCTVFNFSGMFTICQDSCLRQLLTSLLGPTGLLVGKGAYWPKHCLLVTYWSKHKALKCFLLHHSLF